MLSSGFLATLSAMQEEDREQLNPFTIFSYLWASATLFHFYSYQSATSLKVALFLSAIAVLFWPKRRILLVLLACVQLADFGYDLPRGSNHWWITAFINLGLIGSYFITKARYVVVVDRDWLSIFRTYTQKIILITYFWVVFHKLNYDFFNPKASCALELFYSWRYLDGLFSTHVEYLIILLTIFIELAIFGLLMLKSTRYLGVALGSVFHFVIALNPYQPYYNFSSMLFAAYFLFLPNDYTQSIQNRIVDKLGSFYEIAVQLKLLPITFLIVLFSQDRIAWVLYGLALIMVFVFAKIEDTDKKHEKLGFLSCLCFVFFVNGLCPYLGLKTESSLAMYSNLRTETKPNHFLIKDHLKLFSLQEPVEILASSDPELERYANSKIILSYFEFVNLVAKPEYRDKDIQYRHNGKLVSLEHISDNSLLTKPYAYILRKLFWFRRIDLVDPVQCSH
ncbi:MAG: hypothetical protein H6619_04175 [Deltaproteobacteria bacterium]|nr:hypothetical protein [Deltaproteobacteria bacterium]